MSIPTNEGSTRMEIGVKVPTHDEVSLETDIYRPQNGNPLPTILIRLPYSSKNPALIYLARAMAARGFAVVLQNARGRYGSGGTFTPFLHERDDGYDTLVWLSKQKWSNNQVGLLGWSYSSHANYSLMAMELPKGIEISSAVSCIEVVDPYMGAYRNGALVFHWALPWCLMMKGTNQQLYKRYYNIEGDKVGMSQVFRLLPLKKIPEKLSIPIPMWNEWLNHPYKDDYWREFELNKDLNRIRTPILHITGWYDFCLSQTILAYQCLSRKLDNQALIVGPWDHENVFSAMMRAVLPQDKHQDKSFGSDTSFDLFDTMINWFDDGFKGGKNSLLEECPVHYYVLRSDRWLKECGWPPEGIQWANYYFDEKGALTPERPGRQGQDSFKYDPADPSPTIGGAILIHRKDFQPGPLDQSSVEARPDVLLYTTPPFDRDLEVTGPLQAVLFASSSSVDTDFTVKLVDLFPDQTPRIVQDGIMRARFRESNSAACLLEPGQIYKFEIDLAATSYVFKQGHAIRVEVSSSNFPKFDRNLNKVDEFGEGEEFEVAEQTIYRGGANASYICLPIMKTTGRD